MGSQQQISSRHSQHIEMAPTAPALPTLMGFRRNLQEKAANALKYKQLGAGESAPRKAGNKEAQKSSEIAWRGCDTRTAWTPPALSDLCKSSDKDDLRWRAAC